MKSPMFSVLRALLLAVVGGGMLAGCAVYPVHPFGHGHGHGYAGYGHGYHGYGGGWAGHRGPRWH